MLVKILGSGCAKCNRLEKNVRDIVEKHGLDHVTVEKVTDLTQMLTYGIMMTPGLIVDDQVKSAGAVPRDKQILVWLSEGHNG